LYIAQDKLLDFKYLKRKQPQGLASDYSKTIHSLGTGSSKPTHTGARLYDTSFKFSCHTF